MEKREAFRRQNAAYAASESTLPYETPYDNDVDQGTSEDEKDEIAKNCLRSFNIAGMLLSVIICGASLYATTLAVGPSTQNLIYSVAGMNAALILTTAVGFVAACRTVRVQLLLIILACLALLSFGFCVVSGFCFILTESLVRYTQANYDALYASFPPALRAKLTLDLVVQGMRGFLYSFGGLSFVEALMCLGACSSAIRLVTPLKAYTLLLQASNLAVLPVGVVLIAIGTCVMLAPGKYFLMLWTCTGTLSPGAYLADTGIGAEGPIAAFSMFVLGIIVIVVMLVGCIGTSLQV